MSTSRLQPATRWSAIGVAVLAAIFCLLGSWIPSLWGDEAASLLSATRPLSSLFQMLGHVDAVHGTYYLGLHFWIHLVGTSPFALRLPSALAIGACVGAVVLLGARLDSLTLGIVAGVMCAVLPRISFIGEETRSYALSAAIAAWLTLLLVWLMDEPRPRARLWVGYTALLTAGIYVFLYLILIALAHGVILLLADRRRALIRSWIIADCAAILAASPVLLVAILQHGQIAYLRSRSVVTVHSVAVTLWFGTLSFAIVAWALFAIAFGNLALSWRARRTAGGMFRAGQVAFCWLLVPSILLISSYYLIPDFTARYLSMCAPAAALAMGIALVQIGRHRLAWMALGTAAVVLIAVPEWIQERGPYAMNNSDWAQISAHLAAHAHPGDAVVFDESVRPSRRPRLALRTYPAGFAGLEDVTLHTPFAEYTSWHDSAYSVAETNSLGRFAGVDTVWLIEYATPSHTDNYGLSELKALGFGEKARIRDFRSVIVELARS